MSEVLGGLPVRVAKRDAKGSLPTGKALSSHRGSPDACLDVSGPRWVGSSKNEPIHGAPPPGLVSGSSWCRRRRRSLGESSHAVRGLVGCQGNEPAGAAYASCAHATSAY
jgi:hypothetical protein